jgi:hypothetical protein
VSDLDIREARRVFHSKHECSPTAHWLGIAALDRIEELERAYRQACMNLATVRPDLSRNLSLGENADLYYDALLAGWGGIEGWPGDEP